MGEILTYSLSSPLSRLAVILTLLAGVLVGPLLARALRWSTAGTILAIWGLGLAVLPTLVARVGREDAGLDLRAANECLDQVSPDWLSTESLLNLVLLVPFGIGLLWASRSALIAGFGVVLLGIGIEVSQQVTGLGACERGDLIRNIAGGLVAVAVARVVQRVLTPDEEARYRVSP